MSNTINRKFNKTCTLHFIFYVPTISPVLTHGHGGQLAGGSNGHRGPCYSMYVMYSMFFQCLNLICGKFQYNKYLLNFFDTYSFILVSGCIGMVPSTLLFMGAHDAVKTTLLIISFTFNVTLSQLVYASKQLVYVMFT